MENKNNITNPMLFIVGNSRSGTTMMARILDNHPDVLRLQELHFFEELWVANDKDTILSASDASSLAMRLLCAHREDYILKGDTRRYYKEAEKIIGAIPEDNLTSAQVFKAFLGYEVAKKGKSIPCENTPRNVFYISDILELFPEARIINMIRDPRDVLLSQKKKWRMRRSVKRVIPYREVIRLMINYHPITISKLWNSSIAATEKYAGNNRVLSISYEALLDNPKKVVRRICNFIDIDFHPKMPDIPHAGSSTEKDNVKQKGIRRDRIGGWKKGGLNSTEIYLCQNITHNYLKRNHYEHIAVRPNPLMLIYYFVSFPVKITLAIFLNLKRMRNIVETIKRRLA